MALGDFDTSRFGEITMKPFTPIGSRKKDEVVRESSRAIERDSVSYQAFGSCELQRRFKVDFDDRPCSSSENSSKRTERGENAELTASNPTFTRAGQSTTTGRLRVQTTPSLLEAAVTRDPFRVIFK